MSRLIVALAVLAAACGPSSSIPPSLDAGVVVAGARDAVPPGLKSTSPNSGSVDVAVRPSLSLEFSENMDSTSISLSSTPALAFAAPVAEAPNRYSVALTADAQPGTVYTVTVDGTDVAGNQLAGLASFSFTTAMAAPTGDTVKPTFVSATPKSGTVGISRCDETFTLRFSEPMDRRSVEGALRLKGPLVTKQKTSWNALGTEMSLTMGLCLPAGLKFSVSVDVGAKDLAGNAFEAPVVLNYRTAQSFTVALEADDKSSGTIQEDFFRTTPTIFANEVYLGATRGRLTSSYSRGFVAFNLSSLPDNARITNAGLQLTVLAENGNPFNVLGALSVVHIGSYVPLSEKALTQEGIPTCQGNVVPARCVEQPGQMVVASSRFDGAVNWDVSGYVKDDFANRKMRSDLTHLRLQFDKTTGSSVTGDGLTFHPLDARNVNERPTLTITYETP